MATTLIRNGRLVNEGQIRDGDLLIRGQRIQQVGGSIPVPDGATVIDAAGALVMPGMIDDQVHFREPGFEHKGDIRTESRAAVAGGITSYMEMPNCNPLTISEQALRDKHHRAEGRSLANWAFYLGATNDNLEAIKSVDPYLTCGIKVFMGASTGDMLVDDRRTLEGIFSSTSLLVATHCEDTPTILANEARVLAEYGDNAPAHLHPEVRSAEACWKSSSMAVALAKRHGTRLHVLHLTTARELELFTPGPRAGKQITVEACAHHLFFDSSWYERKGADIKCNPAIKRPEDRMALLAAVAEDRIDVIATDHAPHTIEEKARPFMKAPAGLPLVQHAVQSVLEHWHEGVLSLEQVVDKICHAPADLYHVQERGYLREGYFADVLIVDPHTPCVVDEQKIWSKCGWTPFAGITFRSSINTTLVNGTVVFRNQDVVVDPADTPAMALTFRR